MAGLLPFIATCLSIALGLSPLKSIGEIQNKGSTLGTPFPPFFALLFNGSLATFYGFYIQNWLVIFPNAVNTLLATFYVLMYYTYSLDKRQVLTWLAAGGGGFLLIWYHVVVRIPGEMGRMQLGIICNLATVYLFASPLSSLATVIRTRNASSIPVAMSLASLASSIVWLLFGITLGDVFIILPNVCGIVLSTLQLSLVARYGQHTLLAKDIEAISV